MKRKIVNFVLSLIGPIALVILLTTPIGPLAGGLQIITPTGGIFDVGLGANQSGMQTIQLPGLEANVEVLQDQYGVPHIYADSKEDAFMALGYLHARNRLFQMVMQNYLAAGRISEIVGGYANSSDKFYRTIGLARAAERTLAWYEAHMNDPLVKYAMDTIDAEVAGVNAFISSMTSATTPIEFKLLGFTPEPWRRLDIFIWANMMTWGLSGGINDLYWQWLKTTTANDTLFNDLIPDVMPYTVPIISEQYNLSYAEYPDGTGGFPGTPSPALVQSGAVLKEAYIPEETAEALLKVMDQVIRPFGDMELVGSNNWVAHGNKTSTGLPILCNDPHLDYQTPGIWYEAHLVVPGEINVMGVTLAGLPGVILGHTEHMAWGFTNVGADVLDIFVEQLNPTNPNQYMYNDAYRDFEIVDETIHTKEGNDIPFNVSVSVHGPCIDSVTNVYDSNGESGRNLAMNWTGNDIVHNMIAIGLLNQANTLQEYFDALFYWDNPAQNIIYADDEGNIALTVCGRFPVRSGYRGDVPVTALNDSVGMVSNIPYAYIPRAVNPSQGYIQSANQLSIDPTTYGFDLVGPFDDGYRGRRIDYLLDNDDSITIDDMKRFQADALEVRAQEIVPYVVAAWDNVDDDNATVAEVVGWLDDWNYYMETDEEAPTVWMFLLDALHYEVFDELRELGLPLSRTPVLEKLIRENNEYYLDDHTTSEVETCDEILMRALYRSLDAIVADESFGSDMSNWQYGNKHKVYFDHLAGLTTIGGDPQRGQNTLMNAGGWRNTHGPSWRLVADLSNIDMSYGIAPPGQSGNPFSNHFEDLYKIWQTYDSDTHQYGYKILYFYATAEAFRNADTDGSMIEAEITFIP
jgi:penicillin amidase